MDRATFKRVLLAQTVKFEKYNKMGERPEWPCDKITGWLAEQRGRWEEAPEGCCGCGCSEEKRSEVEADIREEAKRRGVSLPECMFEDKPSSDDTEYRIIPFAVLIAVANSNSHNYKLGQPVLLKAGSRQNLTTTDIEEHNYFTKYTHDVRTATEEEIDLFLDKAKWDDIKVPYELIPLEPVPLEKAPLEKVPDFGKSKKKQRA